jgi:hypothetical protein
MKGADKYMLRSPCCLQRFCRFGDARARPKPVLPVDDDAIVCRQA